MRDVIKGKNDQVGILMLHGFTAAPDQFEEMKNFFEKHGFVAKAPLIAGHGTSAEDLMRTSPEEWIESVREAFLDLRKKTKKVFIIGSSFGSNLGFYLAKEFKGDVLGIAVLGAPIYLRFHNFIKFRLFAYGWMFKFYKKPLRNRTGPGGKVYPKIPVKSLKDLFAFIEKETMPGLKEVEAPVLIIHSKKDPVSHPKSAMYIYQHLSSKKKYAYMAREQFHVVSACEKRHEIFNKILNFVKHLQKHHDV